MVVRSLLTTLGYDVNDSGAKKYTQGLKKLAKSVAVIGAGVTAGVTALGIKSSKAWDVQAEAISNVKATLESTNGVVGHSLEELEKQASSLQKNTFFGDEAILSGVTSQMLTFTNITGEQFTRAQAVILDVTAKLNGLNAGEQQLKGTTLQLSKALNDPVGNLSALSRSGIQFSETQKDMINGLVESGKKEEAQNLILKELEKQYGGTAEALTKTTKGLKIQAQNIKGDKYEQLGKALVPLRRKLYELSLVFMEKLTPYIKRFTKFLDKNMMGAFAKVQKGVKKVVKAFSKFEVLGTIGDLFKFIIGLIKVFGRVIAKVFSKSGKSVTDMMSGWLQANKKIIASGIVKFVNILAKAFEIILTVLKKVLSKMMKLKEPISEIVDKIKLWVQANKEVINSRIDTFVENLKNGFGKLKEILIGVINTVIEYKELIYVLIGAITAYKIALVAVNVAQAIQKGLMAVGPIFGFIKAMVSLVKTEGILTTAQYALNLAMKANLIGVIITAVALLVTGIILLVKNWDKVKEVLDVVWSKMKEFGAWVSGGFVQIIGMLAEKINVLKSKFFEVVENLKVIGENIKNFFIGLVSSIVGTIKTIIDTVINAILSVIDTIFAPINAVIDLIKDLAEKFDVIGKLKGVAGKIAGVFGIEATNTDTGSNIPQPTYGYGGRSGGNSNMTVNANITVPEGTPEQQRKSIEKSAEIIFNEKMRKLYGNGIIGMEDF